MISRITLASLSALQKQGSGLPVVMLHGISSDAESFRTLMEILPNPCLAWDMSGYGKSPLLAGDYIAHLKAFTAHLPQFILLGSSLGALIAGKFASLNSVSKLILASPASGYNSPTMPPNVAARLEMLANEGATAYAAKRAGNLIYHPEHKPKILANVQRAMSGLNVPALTKASQFLSESDMKAYGTPVQTHIIVGENDAITPPAGVKALLPFYKNATYHEIPDAGHALIQEQPQAIASLL